MKKVKWKDISHIVKSINKEFYNLMAPFSDLEFPLYIAEYKYGDYFGVKSSVFLPDDNSNLYLLGGKDTPNDIMKDLGYGKDSLPLAIILDKYCEWNNIDPLSRKIFPRALQGPGTICNQGIVFEHDLTMENSQTSAAAGAQTAFLLPCIGRQASHERIQVEFNIDTDAPKSYYDHNALFKELLSKNYSEHEWKAKILYFSYNWIDKIKNEKSFGELREYLYRSLWLNLMKATPLTTNGDPFISSNIANDLKPTPFSLDSARYMFNLMLGSNTGFIPSTNNNYLPLKSLQDIYTDCYKINYTPTVMVPCEFSGSNPVYYSLQYPSAQINSFKGSKSNSKFQELANIAGVIATYHNDFSKHKTSSPLKKSCLSSKFIYYHHKAKKLESNNKDIVINPSELIKKEDDRFCFSYNNTLHFPVDAKFFRGCIKLTKTNYAET